MGRPRGNTCTLDQSSHSFRITDQHPMGKRPQPATQAAARAGVSEHTIRRWLAIDAEFQANYTTARQTVSKNAIHRHRHSRKALSSLLGSCAPEVQAAVRLGAARLILEVGLPERDAETIFRRLDALERAVQERTE